MIFHMKQKTNGIVVSLVFDKVHRVECLAKTTKPGFPLFICLTRSERNGGGGKYIIKRIELFISLSMCYYCNIIMAWVYVLLVVTLFI